MLREHFNIPVFINNDGDLFAYGEAIAFSALINKKFGKQAALSSITICSELPWEQDLEVVSYTT
jgi:hypothetical protein